MRLALLVVVVPAVVAAKPLPAGFKIDVIAHRLTASAGGESVELTDHDAGKLGKVELDDDGKTLEIAVSLCEGMFGDEGEPIPFDLPAIQAKLENLAGMRAQLKKKYADAIPHFTAAAKLDPETALYATNLLSAQAMAGKLDDADRTLATYASKNVAWFAWRLQVDSDLRALRGRPSTKSLAAAKRGTAKTKQLGDSIAYSPLGLAAMELSYDMWDGIPDGSGSYQLVIVDLKTGKEALTLPTERTCAVDMEKAMRDNATNPPPADKKCPAKEAAAAAPKLKVTDELLASLGFEIAPKAFEDAIKDGEMKKQIVARDGRKLDTDKMTIAKGKQTKAIQLSGRPFGFAFVPGALVVMTRTGKHIARCEADGNYRMSLEAFADP